MLLDTNHHSLATIIYMSCSDARYYQMMYLSKMTAAILDDLDYVVDPSGVSLGTVRPIDPSCVRTKPICNVT